MVKLVLSMTRAQKRFVLLFLDVGFVPLAFVLASVIQYSTMTPYRFLLANWPLVPLLMVSVVALSMVLGTADIRLKHYDVAAAQRTALFAMMLAFASVAFAKIGQLHPPAGFHVVLGFIFFALSSGSRILLLKVLLAIYRESTAISRVLIYGAGRTGMLLAAALRSRADILPIAFLDDNATLRGLIVAGLPVYSGAHIERILKQHRIDRVVLAMPTLSVHKQSLLSNRIARLGLEVQALPAFAQLIGDEGLVDKLQPAGPGALLSREGLHDEIATGCNAYSNSNIMITGAGGSIGLELCRQVIACLPTRVVLFELSEIALYNAEIEMRVLTEGLPIEIVPVLGSVGDGPLVERCLNDNEIDVVLHAAAYKHVPIVEMNARAGIANNALATATFAQKVRACNVARFVLVSSDKAVRSASVMGASKRVAELVIQGQAARPGKTVFSIVRFGNVMG
ncbi:MAG: polysaccharide biosynthesis protein, partial [Albidovulum sp.]